MWSWMKYKLMGRTRDSQIMSMMKSKSIIGHVVIGALMFMLGRRTAPSR